MALALSTVFEEHHARPAVIAEPFEDALARLDPHTMSWADYEYLAATIQLRFAGRFVQRTFDYIHPKRLQRTGAVRFRRDYAVPVSYTLWGDSRDELVICMGGIANSARRFDFLADSLSQRYQIAAMDWVGRGTSGWMAHTSHYNFETLVEQTLALIRHLGRDRVTLLGSSQGGSVATAIAAAHPRLVKRVIYNDFGPYVPGKRRRRRAEALDRFYVFRSPADVFRRNGASQKHDGPVGDDILLHNSYHQTKWSAEESGRIYRHDPRAMAAFANDARESLTMWDRWERVKAPVLVIHGMESDALLPPTVNRMALKRNVTVLEVPDTGHTPALGDDNHIAMIEAWLADPTALGQRVTGLYAPARWPRRLFG